MEKYVDIPSYTTLPRKSRDRLPTAEELQEMSVERRLATLHITESQTPVPPPRSRRLLKHHHSLPDHMAASPPANAHELYAERSRSFSSDPRYTLVGSNYRDNGFCDSATYTPSNQPFYPKYEGTRKNKHDLHTDGQPMCDIIQSSQQKSGMQPLHRPDILRGSFKADIQSKLASSSNANRKTEHSNRPQYNIRQDQMDDKNHKHSGKHSRRNTDKASRHDRRGVDSSSTRDKTGITNQKTPDMGDATAPCAESSGHANNRFIFYRPKLDISKKQNTVIGLPGVSKANHEPESLCYSPEGSFINPAFDISDLTSTPRKTASRPKCNTSTTKPSKSTYSTMGASYSTRPCTPSPPSHRFRHQKPPLPTTEEEVFLSKPLGPTPIKPMLSAQRLEASLKHYPSPSKINTNDMCSPQAIENMMKYYQIEGSSQEAISSPSPLSKLSSSKKNQSPYSSTGSLNVSGDSIDVVLRRKKKVKIRPPSISSDDEVVKRVSLEINLAPSASPSKEEKNESAETSGRRKSLSASQTSLNQAVEKLDLDDLTSTETAKLLRKQFTKLKVKASNLKVKDNELKQRFALLQNQRGRVCGHGGGVTKSKIRSSPIML